MLLSLSWLFTRGWFDSCCCSCGGGFREVTEGSCDDNDEMSEEDSSGITFSVDDKTIGTVGVAIGILGGVFDSIGRNYNAKESRQSTCTCSF